MLKGGMLQGWGQTGGEWECLCDLCGLPCTKHSDRGWYCQTCGLWMGQMSDFGEIKQDSKLHWLEKVRDKLPDHDIRMGRATGNAYVNDPRMLAFILARYKFVAKMLAHKSVVLEVGCGDAFGTPLVAQETDILVATDIDEETLAENRIRCRHDNIDFQFWDFREKSYPKLMDGIYAVDVIEHIYPKEEERFLQNMADSLTGSGVMLLGTPNTTASVYASEYSKRGHVNLKSWLDLMSIGARHFDNFFLFGQSDEVIHTGYFPMCQYLWLLAVGPKR